MTQPFGLSGSQRPTTSATAVVNDRIFFSPDNARFVHEVPTFLTPELSGLALCGSGSNGKIGVFSHYLTSPAFSDPAAYHKAASAGTPFALPAEEGALFGSDLTPCYRASAMRERQPL